MIRPWPPRRGAVRPLLGVLTLSLAGGCTGSDPPPAVNRFSSPPSVTTSAAPTTSAPTTRETGALALRIESPSYRRHEAIVVLLENTSSVDWYAVSGRTWCTIVEAQRRVGSGYRAEGPCTEGAPPGPVKIPAGSEQRLELEPGGSNTPLPAGRYRLHLLASESSPDGPARSFTSMDFTIVE